jgi:hypothetical protein
MKTIVNGKICAHRGCNKVAIEARKLGPDWWVQSCGMHEQITIDFTKIPSSTIAKTAEAMKRAK